MIGLQYCSVLVHMCMNNFLELNSNHIINVMVSMLTSSAVDCGFESGLGQIKDNKIDICCFFTKGTAFRFKSKDWLVLNQDNVSKFIHMST
jgi:hypothetical protein